MFRKEIAMYDNSNYYYDKEHTVTNMTNTVTNIIAQNFTFYFHYKYNLPLDTVTYKKDLNEIFFSNGVGCCFINSLGTLCKILRENGIAYKEYYSAISVNKEDLYNLVAYIKMQGEWRDEWKYFK
ncbi:MAG: hypothetical protein IJ890_00570 [Clostridia bacterium]|nr:hypothetical protein [Clostridia bacterium]